MQVDKGFRAMMKNGYLMIPVLLCAFGLSACVFPAAKKAVVVDETHGAASINIWRQHTLIEDDGKNIREKTGPGNYGIELIRVFKKGVSWSQRMAQPDAIIWKLYDNQWPQQVEVILPEGDYIFEKVMISFNGSPYQVQAGGDGLFSFHVTAGKKTDVGDVFFEYVKNYRVYPDQRVTTRFMRFKCRAKDSAGNLKSDQDKKLNLDDV